MEGQQGRFFQEGFCLYYLIFHTIPSGGGYPLLSFRGCNYCCQFLVLAIFIQGLVYQGEEMKVFMDLLFM